MLTRRHKLLPGLALGLFCLLALTGCGGSQNPYSFATGRTPLFFNGLWDGLTAWLVLIKDLIGPGGYEVWTHGADLLYWPGYGLGWLIVVGAVGWFLDLLYDLLHRPHR